MTTKRSQALYGRALHVMAGGVSSPVRAFKAVGGGTPRFIARGKGQRIWDVDGNELIDYVLSWGPLILGHAHPAVVRAVDRAVRRGTSFGAPTEWELKLAEQVSSSIPSMELVRFVNSGTEATMSALRVAKAYTKRSKVLKFDGCYHGHADPYLSRAGSGLATLDIPASAGVSERVTAETITVPFNGVAAVEEAVAKHGSDLAAIIVEPVAGNMGVVPPGPGFLESLRKTCDDNGSILIFDEVITGFRLSRGGAQALLSIEPDMTCIGKILGGGFPVGAYGAKREIMQLLSPDGPVYQAGTLSGNPVAMVAGSTTISLMDERRYARLEEVSTLLEEGLLEASRQTGLPITINRVGSMLGLFFGEGPVRDFADAKKTNHRLYPRFHRVMLESGIYLPPSPFETIFLSTAHAASDVQATLKAVKKAFREVV
jgi:glutamate-1-semialdehyde 2,1-aminomutase